MPATVDFQTILRGFAREYLGEFGTRLADHVCRLIIPEEPYSPRPERCSCGANLHESANGIVVCLRCDRIIGIAGPRTPPRSIPWERPRARASSSPPFPSPPMPADILRDAYRTLKLRAPSTVSAVQSRRRKLALEHHPDRGGKPGKMAAVNAAADAIVAHLEGKRHGKAQRR